VDLANGMVRRFIEFDGTEMAFAYTEHEGRPPVLRQITCPGGLNLNYSVQRTREDVSVVMDGQRRVRASFDANGRPVEYSLEAVGARASELGESIKIGGGATIRSGQGTSR
jgi:hypothetical protein